MDDSQPQAEEVLISGGKIAALKAPARMKNVRELDLDGRAVVPGFFDSHTHMVQYGSYLGRLDILETGSKAEALEMVAGRVGELASGSEDAVVAVNWDETRWRERQYPHREELDQISRAVPIVMRRICGHVAVANTRALERFENSTEEVDIDSGLLLEAPALELDKRFPVQDMDDVTALQHAIKKAHSLGITGFSDMTGPEHVHAHVDLHARGLLEARTTLYVTGPEPTIQETQWFPGKGVGWKMFLDGSLGAWTAALKEPYENNAENRGMLLISEPEFESRVRIANTSGVQIAAHAIGDAAVAMAVSVLARNPGQISHRIEHLELADREDIELMASSGIIASMQPNFAGNWSRPGGMNMERLGTERCQRAEAFRRVLDAGVNLAFGSDCMPLSPLYGIASAVEHPVGSQRLSVHEAFRAYTLGSASASGMEGIAGSLANGKAADLVVLSGDPFVSGKVSNIEVDMTFYNGESVYERREE